MDEREVQSLRKVHDALEQRGFVRDWSNPERLIYQGHLDPTDLNVPISIEINDLDFVKPPLMFIDQRYPINGRQLPHLLGDQRSFCYFAAGSVVFDRYNPGGTVLQCLEQADKVIRDAIRGRSNTDFADEFHSYWGETFLLVDLPPDFVGQAKVRFLNLRKTEYLSAVLCLPDSWLIGLHRKNGTAVPSGEECTVVEIDCPLSLDPNGQWPPKTLAELNSWLAWSAPNLVGLLENSFAKGKSSTRWVAVRAPNGIFVYGSTLPRQYQKAEFLEVRRSQLPAVIGRISATAAVERASGVRADPDYIFNRNMGKMRNLSGRQILLVGCGTIGGFVAHQLAQSGAGAGGGRLVLADPDKLGTANLGRHLLGVPYLHRNKAEGCRGFILEQLPLLDIVAHPGDARDLLNYSRVPFDLIVDATGEEALSLSLNERGIQWRSAWPPIIFGYLIGNGAIAQAILTGDPQYACLKCLKPKLSGVPRYRTMRPGVEVDRVTNLECGDALHVPFPVSRSVAAAALISDLALNWVSGGKGHRFRSILFDPERAFFVKDGSPAPLDDCPACAKEI